MKGGAAKRRSLISLYCLSILLSLKKWNYICLPVANGMIFWTNEVAEGGQKLKVTTVFNRIPLYVRAGSIVPLGPDVQYVTEEKWDNLKVCVYPGADGNFVLYEDEGNNYNYENGAYTEIPMTWNDAKRTLTIDARRGCYEGMLDERKFTVRMPDGSEKTVLYKGKK